MRFHTNWAHARPAAAMGNTEGLVQVEVANIAAQIARARQANHRVHIRAVDIDLATMLMCDLADFMHGFFETPRGLRDR